MSKKVDATCKICERIWFYVDKKSLESDNSFICLACKYEMKTSPKHQYIVTVKLPREGKIKHNPNDKKIGKCVMSDMCTDVTGHHHSVLVEAGNIKDIKDSLKDEFHITRIERVHNNGCPCSTCEGVELMMKTQEVEKFTVLPHVTEENMKYLDTEDDTQ